MSRGFKDLTKKKNRLGSPPKTKAGEDWLDAPEDVGPKPTKKPERNVQLNLRVTESEKIRFDVLAAKARKKKSELFSEMLDRYEERVSQEDS